MGVSLAGIAKAASVLTPLGEANAIANKVSGGRIGFDPTQNFSAQHVLTTQAHKLFGSPQTGEAATGLGFAKWGTGAGGGDVTGDGGGGYGGDPYAGTPFGSTAGYNQARADFEATRGNTFNSINDVVGQQAGQYNSSILDYLDSLRGNQQKINNQVIQNELARQQGATGVLDMVGHGIRSGGVVLANKNASSSSAADALARAYGDIGRRQLSGVNNQYLQGQNAINEQQTNLDVANQQQLRHAEENKNNIVNSIVSDATAKLSQLNQAAIDASLPDRIEIEQEKANIRNQALAKLQEFDAVLSQGIANTRQIDRGQARQKANEMATAGVAPENAFNFTTEAPAQFQGTGPFASELPIFTLPTAKKQFA